MFLVRSKLDFFLILNKPLKNYSNRLGPKCDTLENLVEVSGDYSLPGFEARVVWLRLINVLGEYSASIFMAS